MVTFNQWLKSEDATIAMDNWDNAGDYEEDEYHVYMKDKYEEYRVFNL